jgi:hypothetical protein
MRADGGGDGRAKDQPFLNANDEFIALLHTGWAAERAEQSALPIRIRTGVGAQVALQRCPILRASVQNSITKLNRAGNTPSLFTNHFEYFFI